MLATVALLLSLAQAGPPAAALAADPGRLDRLRREAADLQRRNRDLGEAAGRLTAEMEALVARRDLAAAESGAVTARLTELESAVEGWATREASFRQRDQEARAALAARLRRLQQLGPAATPAAVALASSPAEAVAALRALTDAAALDRRVARQARDAREAAVSAAAELESGRADLEATRTRAEAARLSAQKAIAEYEARLRQIQTQEAVYTRAAAEIGEAAEALNGFLTGRLKTPPPGPDPLSLRGAWPWPAVGPVLQGFGPRRHPRFGTRLPHNGLAIGAPSGAEVRAVADGTVVFADWFQGYGRTVIIDHGSGLMTVYSHLSAVIVAPGDVLDRGRLLGLVGDSGSLEGSRLYFEVRRDGVPQNPAEWLAGGA